MPKFYCDYCDIYLAHSSIGGRRQHTIGRKHIQNKIDYYQKVAREQGPTGVPMMPFMASGGDPLQAMAAFQAMMQGRGPPPGPPPFPLLPMQQMMQKPNFP